MPTGPTNVVPYPVNTPYPPVYSAVPFGQAPRPVFPITQITQLPQYKGELVKPNVNSLQTSLKSKKRRARFSADEVRVLELSFQREPVPSADMRRRLAQQLKVPSARIVIWSVHTLYSVPTRSHLAL